MGKGPTSRGKGGAVPGDTEGESLESWLREAARLRDLGEAPLAPGSELFEGRFMISTKLGEGGMGVVYEALDRERRERVALKTLPWGAAAKVYRLKQEFRALAEVRHPNLVRLHELFNHDGRWYFTMELLESQPIDAWLRPGGRLDRGRLFEGLAQLAAAVNAIHAAGKLHRDLKPSNVLVDGTGRVVVLDFGLVADPEAGGVGQTIEDDSVSGTPGYMAPEQAAGKPASEASDWYAVGVMLFEVLTGRLPFEGRVGEILAAKQTRPAPTASSIAEDVPRTIDQLCAELLVCDPAARAGAAAVRAVVGDPQHQPPEDSCHAPIRTFVGREAELDALESAYVAARDGRKPVMVLLQGESGIGKSALVEHFLTRLRATEPAAIFAGRCYERESVPFKAFDAIVDSLSRYLRRLGRDADVLMPRDISALRRLFPVLGRIKVVAEAPARQVDDVHELRRRGFAALGELLARMRDRAPLVVHIDDLQWSDADSTVLLMHLLRLAEAPRLLYVVSHRSEATAQDARLEPLYTRLPTDLRVDCRLLTLGPLPREAISKLAGGLQESAWRDAGGNPFLLSELARAADRGTAPATLTEALRYRIAELQAPERALLQVLAVCGRRVRLDTAAKAAGVPERGRALFDGLHVARLARSSSVPGHVETYHDKIREAALERLSEPERKAIHRALAATLLDEHAPDPEHLMVHLWSAGEPERAVPYAVLAGDRAAAALAFQRAAELYRLGLEWGTHAQDTQRHLRLKRAEALDHAGLGAEAGEAYLEALEGASGDEAFELKHRAGRLFLFAGHMAQGRKLMQDALVELGLDSPRSTVSTLAGYAYHKGLLRVRGLGFRERGPASPGLDRNLRALFSAAFSMLRSEQLYGAYFSARYVRAALRCCDPTHIALAVGLEAFMGSQMVSDGQRLRRASQQALELAERIGSAEAADVVLFGWAHLEWMGLNNNEEALRLLDRELALHREHVLPGASFNLAWVRSSRLLIQSMGQGRFQDVAAALPALIDEGWTRNDLCIAPFLVGYHMLTRLAVEDLAAAEQDHARAQRAWSAPNYTLQDNALVAGAAWLHLYRGEPDKALEVVTRGWQRLRRSPQRNIAYLAGPLAGSVASVALSLAWLESRRGKRAELLRRADAFTRRIPKGRGAASAAGPMISASASALRGDVETAATRLRRALEEDVCGWMGFHRQLYRRALGVLIGGDEGNTLLAEADAWFRDGGVVDPERLSHCFTPGFQT